MNLPTSPRLGLQWSPENLHEVFFPILAVLAVVWVFYAWRRGDGVFGTAGLALAALTLFYLTSPYASDSARWWAGGGIVLVGGGMLWRARERAWKPVFVSSAILVALLAVILTSSSVNLLYFEKFLVKVVAFHVTGCVAWLVFRAVLPRTKGKTQTVRAAGFTVVLSIVLLSIAASWWHQANDAERLAAQPIATTAAEISDWFETPLEERRHGAFVAGVVGDPSLRSEGPGDPAEYLAYFAEPQAKFAAGGGTFKSRLPSRLELLMEDGASVSFPGIRSIKQSSRWPDGGPHLWHHALRHGDPIVVWGDWQESDSEPVPDEPFSLHATRVVAHGTPDSFRGEFLSDLLKTARVFGWVARVCVLLSFIPLGCGIRHLFRNRGQGFAVSPENP